VHVRASGLREIVLDGGRVVDARPAALPTTSLPPGAPPILVPR
jgi:hypothetical protein